VQREPPARHAFALGTLPRRPDRAFRQARQASLAVDDQIERVGGVQHVLGELGGQRAQLHVDGRQPRLSRGVQIRAVPPEIVHRLGQEPPPRPRQAARFLGRGVALQHLPQPLVERDARMQLAHLGLHLVDRRAQVRMGGNRLQMLHNRHGPVQRFGQLVERPHRVLEIRRRRQRRELLDAPAR
jgi:hypothetical protein